MRRRIILSFLAVTVLSAALSQSAIPARGSLAEIQGTSLLDIPAGADLTEEPESEGPPAENELALDSVDPVETVDLCSPGRVTVNINDGWSFASGTTDLTGWQFPDGQTDGEINLPHSWEYVHPTKSYIPAFNKKTVTYSRRLDVSEISQTSKRLFVKFHGVSKNAAVYVDDELAGSHVGGYSAFTIDITDYVKGKESVTLKVEVTNIDTASIPVNVDYTQWAGIYRDVDLIATDEQYISTENSGSSGIFADYVLDNGNATLTTRVDLSNSAASDQDMILETALVDSTGHEVSTTNSKITVAAGVTNQEASVSQYLEDVHLWNGTADPYLYTLQVRLLDSEGNQVDSESTRIGFRTFEIKDGKAYLNGGTTQIHGVGYHQGRESCGSAVTSEEISEDVDTMLEMGVNAIRASHYPHDSYFYELADEKGLLVFAEIPYYMIYSKAQSYLDSINDQLVEMIRQQYNNPSVVMWGVQNEVKNEKAFATYGSDFNVTNEEIIAFNEQLVELARKEDPNRLVVQACINDNTALRLNAQWSGDIDISGINLYQGWYTSICSPTKSGAEQLAKAIGSRIDEVESVFSTNQFMITEYGAGANIEQHAELNENTKFTSSFHPEEYQSWVHEVNWGVISSRNDIPASFVWNMFDFSNYRSEGGLSRINTKGLVTYDHETRKDAFYFYKAVWNSTDKFVHLTSKRFLERPSAKQTIKAYSNCDSVELYLNSESQGLGVKTTDGVFEWENVDISKASSNTLTVVAHDGTEVYEDSVDGICQMDDTNGLPDYYTGWNKDKTRWYDSGTMAREHAFYDPDSDAWYWADADGSIARDKDVYIPKDETKKNADGTWGEGKWVRFDADRRMVKGEDYRYGSWYYFDEITGEMAHHDVYLRSSGGKWVRYDEVTGRMIYGLENRYDAWYYFDTVTGAMAHGVAYVPEWGANHYFDDITGRG